MTEVRVRPEDVTAGQPVTVWIDRGQWRGCGQGGVLIEVTAATLHLRDSLGNVHRFDRADVSVWQEQALPATECLEFGTDCDGEVDYRYPLSGTGRSFPRCERHWGERLARQTETDRRYGGVCPPADFDPAYAGERWDEDY